MLKLSINENYGPLSLKRRYDCHSINKRNNGTSNELLFSENNFCSVNIVIYNFNSKQISC